MRLLCVGQGRGQVRCIIGVAAVGTDTVYSGCEAYTLMPLCGHAAAFTAKLASSSFGFHSTPCVLSAADPAASPTVVEHRDCMLFGDAVQNLSRGTDGGLPEKENWFPAERHGLDGQILC